MPGGYDVQIRPSARREMESLREPTFGRVALAIRELSSNPRPRGARKLAAADSDYRLRVGDYRVLYEVIDEDKTVLVYRIRHRRDAYK